ncbi:MAG: UDP-galactopyranose mutase [Tenericutes bacterium HGW-Tenericutes-2]|nr:MAG: UDP-galactopyranose mutase [Tenericutes bacterium HGW-Tenericutes-2]
MVYDYLIVGAGLFGSVFAYEANKIGKKVLVIDKKNHIGGNVYTHLTNDIHVHQYGAHIFHTSNKEIWDYVNQFAEFNHFINSPIANYKGKIYNLPFNMNTFNQLWGVITPEEAKAKIKEQQKKYFVENPKNLEEQAINLVGLEIYEKLIKGYTEKQWGRDCVDLPSFIIKRLPVRFTYDNNYFNDTYQGIPKKGYTYLIEKMLEGIEVRLETDYFRNKKELDALATKVLYTGPIDQFYNYKYGLLEYRSLTFEHEVLDIENYQGNAVINYTEKDIPYTRIIEHKHFNFGTQPKTVITKEYPAQWTKDKEPYYPINDEKNSSIFMKYKEVMNNESKFIFGGRLAEYKYYDMHVVIESALALVKKEFGKSID